MVSLRRSISQGLSAVSAFWNALDYPLARISIEGDDHALVLIRTIFDMHCNAVLELENDQPIVDDVAASNFPIHDVVESGVWPLAFFPMGHELAVTEKVHWGIHREIDPGETELEIKLTYSQWVVNTPTTGERSRLLGIRYIKILHFHCYT